LQREQRQQAQAEESYLQSLAIRSSLVPSELKGSDDDPVRELAIACDKYGHLLFDQGRIATARAYYQFSLVYRGSQVPYSVDLMLRNEVNPMLRRNYAECLMNLGKVDNHQGHAEKARERYQTALRIYQHLADADPNTFSCQRDLLLCHFAAAEAHKTLKQVAAARNHLVTAKQLVKEWTDKSQENTYIQQELSQYRRRCADFERELSLE
jgi:tetratricopeptide (TPR) repeat protein